MNGSMPRFTIRNMLLATAWLCLWLAVATFAYSQLGPSRRLHVALTIPLGIFLFAGPSLFIALLTGRLARGVKLALGFAALWAFTVGGACSIFALIQ